MAQNSSTRPRSRLFRAAIGWLAAIVYIALAELLMAQAQPAAHAMNGTVKDQSGAVIAGAVVTLQAQGGEQRTAITGADGQFEFVPIQTGTYQITITASGFEPWTAKEVIVNSVENPPAISAVLQVAIASTQVSVGLTPSELAVEQVKEEQKQRVLGVFPNFFVTYEPNPAPLTVKEKFQLGWRTFFDPVPILFSGLGAGIQQARNSYPQYGQGLEGYAKRFGANWADRIDGVLVGHVVMQSVLHQDPRYFYKGTGSFGSRALHAIGMAFVVKGDNGNWQPAYADVLGSAGSYELSTFYRPGTSRPVLRLEHTILLGFAGRAARNLAQEFVLPVLTTHMKKARLGLSQPVLRAGTPVTLISAEDLSGKTVENSGPIEFFLSSDLQADGVVVAKAGAQAWGRVKYSPAPGGAVNLDLERVRLTAGSVEVPLRNTLARGTGPVTFHRVEGSGKIVVTLYVDNDVALPPEK